MIQRSLLEILFQRLKHSPAVALHGARQTGKTTLALQVREKRDGTFSQDTLTDLKHLISSAPIDIFVSGDVKLIKHAKDICPERIIYKTDEYFRP